MSGDVNPNGFEIAAFDPVRAMEQTLFDLVQIVELFELEDTAMEPLEFLRAASTASDRMRAIVSMTTAALMQPVSGKIPDAVRAQFQQEIDLENLMMTPEQSQQKMIRMLKDVSTWIKKT